MDHVNGTQSSRFADLLNDLDEMQQSMAYAVRRPTLMEAERVIVLLEQEHRASQQTCEQLRNDVYRISAKHDTVFSEWSAIWNYIRNEVNDPYPLCCGPSSRPTLLGLVMVLKRERDQLKDELSVAIRQGGMARTELMLENRDDIKQERDQLKAELTDAEQERAEAVRRYEVAEARADELALRRGETVAMVEQLQQEMDHLQQVAQQAARSLMEMHDLSLISHYDFDAGQRAQQALAALEKVGVTP